MNLTVILIIIGIVSLLSLYLGYRWGSEKKDKFSKDMLSILETINKVKSSEVIHPIVKDIYLLFVEEGGYKNFDITPYNLTVKETKIEVWASNEVYDRKFIRIPEDVLKTYNMTFVEANKSLTLVDRTILDTIVQRMRVNNKEFLSRLFI